VIKRLKKKAIERQTQIVAEIYQNRTADKGQIFRGPSATQIEKCKTNESFYITWAYTQGISDKKDILRIFMSFYGAAQKYVLGQQLPQILPPSN
jgi:hypothetical protein